MKKRIISVLLVSCLLSACFMAPVFAMEKLMTKQSVVVTSVEGQAEGASSEMKVLLPATLSRADVKRKVVSTVFVLIIGYLLLFLIVNLVNRGVKNIKARHVIRKNVAYAISFIIFTVIVFMWIQNLNSITIFIGVAGAGLALALQEVILCVAGWVLIMVRHPFEVGDRIEINGIKGDIIDIRLFQTSLLEIGNWVDADQSTGRIVNIPNSFVFKSANFNYSRGFEFIWNEISILVTFESDWRRAKEVMMLHADNFDRDSQEELRRKIEAMRTRYMIYYGKLTPIVYVNIKESGVELTLRYLTEAKKRRSTQDQLCQVILDDFAKEDRVDFAYPTYRIIKN
ncbi:mechanosensitive ion channel family protein [Candidatus Omnitrophota bacterium]